MDLEEIGQVVCGCTKYYVWVSVDLKGGLFPVIEYVHVGVTRSLHDATARLNKKECEKLYKGLWAKIDDRFAEIFTDTFDEENNDDSESTYH